MIEAERLQTLRGVVGDDGVVDHESVLVDDVAPKLSLCPADGDALSRLLVALGELGVSVLVRGGGERSGVGNTPTAGDAFLSTERMAGIDEIDTSDGVCRVRAGTQIDRVREAVRETGWELPLEPPGARSTVGGCIAAGAIGPRTHGYGTPRSVLLGLDVCVGSGERTSCGGRVVKNVTGYDLNKLYTGSFGTLGVIESAWLRLSPIPETSTCFVWESTDLAAACRIAIEASRRVSARVAALVCEASDAVRIVAEFAGDANSVQNDSNWLLGQCTAHAVEPNVIDGLRDRQAAVAEQGLRFRIGVLPSRLETTLRALAEAGATFLSYPGLRVAYAEFILADQRGDLADALFEQVGCLAKDAGGDFLCEAAPAWTKKGRDMFGGVSDLIPIYRALKQRFDPRGVLNPGRFAGRI